MLDRVSSPLEGPDDISASLRETARMLEQIASLLASAKDQCPDVLQHVQKNKAVGSPESQLARYFLRRRRQRERSLDVSLFGEPAWDMLLDLFAASEENVSVSVSSLCIAAGVPGSTAFRWIADMTKRGILIQQPDPSDRRRNWVTLAPTFRERMRQFLRLDAMELIAFSYGRRVVESG